MVSTALAAALGMVAFAAAFSFLLGPLGRRWGTLGATRRLALAALVGLGIPVALRPPWEALDVLLPRASLLLQTLVLIGASMGSASLLEPRLGKSEYRVLFHALAGVIVLFLLWRDPGVALGAIALTFSLYLIAERVRQAPDPNPLTEFVKRVIDRAVRPEEGKWYTPTPLFLAGSMAVIVAWPGQAVASVAVLAFGDPVAALAGSRWGGRRLPWNRDKSWVGTGAFAGVALATALLLGKPAFPALAVGVAAALAESLPGRMDNLLIPLAAGITGETLK
ncbi:MAG: hypothetical protein QXO51_02260 [Halobacteria archaeon]